MPSGLMKKWTVYAGVKRLVKTGLSKVGFRYMEHPRVLRLIQSFDPPLQHPWDDDADFRNLWRQSIGHTLVSEVGGFMLYQFAKHVSSLPGDIAEIGVYKGGTAKLLAKTFGHTQKTVHLFDTFSGMPPTDPNKDYHKKREFADTSFEGVKTYLRDCKNICLYQGVFPFTSTPIEKIPFCLVHFDADLYKSTMDCLTFFYPRLVAGGVMIFDDYGAVVTAPGVKMAVDEFLSGKPEHPCYLPTGQCIVIRRGVS